ncbi:hypothetical protein ACS3SW_11945 [Roseobacteraceae bacterium S113]
MGKLRDSHPIRTERIARCRNAYLDAIEHRSEFQEVSYVVMADLDKLNTHLTKEAVASAWSTDHDRDMCAANQDGPYYDIWALRHASWSPNDCWEQVDFLRNFGVDKKDAVRSCVHVRMITIPRDSDWIEVLSAFGGFAIYKRDAILGCRYEGFDDHGSQICEHVRFHAQMQSKGARLLINPRMINAGVTEHAAKALPQKKKRRGAMGALSYAFGQK